MNTLVAIILVVDSSRGHHFVMQYPNTLNNNEPVESKTQPINQKPDIKSDNIINHNRNKSTDTFYDKEAISDTLEKDIELNSRISKHKKLQLYDTVLGFDPSLLANIFSPKTGLCNKRFQLTIQDLTFIGLPTLIENNKNNKDRQDKNGLENIKENEFTDPYKTFVRVDSNYSQITLFHLVYVLKHSTDSIYVNYNNFEDALYNNVITTYTKALIYEQKRSEYLKSNVELILSLTDEALSNGLSRDELMTNILNASPLAKDISTLYYCITQGKIAQISVNNYIYLSLQVPSNRLDILTKHLNCENNLNLDTYSNNLFGPVNKKNNNLNPPIIRPYHTLLLLDTPEDILKSLPPDASPKLIKLIHVLAPTKSLFDLLPQLDCSMSHMFRLASHLIYWKKAKLIDIISTKNIYTLSPRFLKDYSYEEISNEFSQYFPNIPIADILSFLSSAHQYALVSKDRELRAQYLEAITFLLRKGVAAQLNHYIYLMIPRYIKLGYTQKEIEKNNLSWDGLPNGENNNDNGTMAVTLISDPNCATEAEKEWIKQVANSQVSELTHIFLRLVKYFNGQYHLDEIAYYENISKKDLILILNKYRGDIIAVLHYSDPMLELNEMLE